VPDPSPPTSAPNPSLPRIEQTLARHNPGRKLVRPLLKRSAVALILRQQEGPVELLMIKRADRAGDPWSGHMAFPGGRMDPTDRHGFDVAVRETEEEIGLSLGPQDPCIGRLSEIMTHPQLRRRPMVVTPYVFKLDRNVEFQPNHEVAEVLWVPLPFVLDEDNRQRMEWLRGSVKIPLPCYMYQGRRIWGLSLMMLDELIEMLTGRPIRSLPRSRR
jgi:8-oxo-dGTP pyrophosphatase MutT (NUDIX family)